MPKHDFKLSITVDRTHPENEVAEFLANALRNEAQRYSVSSAFHRVEVDVVGPASHVHGRLGEGDGSLTIDIDSDKLLENERLTKEAVETPEERAIRVTKEAAEKKEAEDKKLEQITQQENENRESLKSYSEGAGSGPVEIGGQPVDQNDGSKQPVATKPLSEGDKQPNPDPQDNENEPQHAEQEPPSTRFKDEVEGTNNPTNGMVTDPPPNGPGATAPTAASNPGQEPLPEPTLQEDLVDGHVGEPPAAETAKPAAAKGGFKKAK